MPRVVAVSLLLALLAPLAAGCGGKKNEVPPQVLEMADRAWCRGDILRAASELENVLKSKPQAFDAIYRLGVMHMEKDPDTALKELAQAAALDPGHPGPVLFTALIHANRNDFAQSDQELARAYALAQRRLGYSVRDTTATLRRALAEFENEHYPAAIAAFDSAAQADPQNGVLAFLKAQAQYRGGFATDALSSVKAVLQKWPDSAQAHVLYGSLLLAQHKDDQAQAEADAALARQPDYAPALELKGRVLLAESEHLDGAIALWRSLLIDPTRAIIHQSLGAALLRSSQPEQATAFLRYVEPLTTFHDRRLGIPTPATHRPTPPPAPGSSAPH
jgi:tetratricopeptide (TPR) repeat protein